MSKKKGFGQDQVFLLAGIVILVITSFLIYTLIGGPYCDDLAKRTANNIKNAVQTVAVTGTYTKDSPYTTYAMLCQNKVGSPLTLNPVDYRAFSTPEYMIYWEHFPESPTGLAEGSYKFDESYPFTKNFAQIAATNIGLSMFSGTLSVISKTKIGKTTTDFASKISKNAAGKVGSVFLPKTLVDIARKPITISAKVIKYMEDAIATKTKAAIRFIVDASRITDVLSIPGKYITSSTSPKLFGRVTGIGFLGAMTDNGLIETVDVTTAEGIEKAVRTIRVVDPGDPAKFIEKAVVPSGKRTDLDELINGVPDTKTGKRTGGLLQSAAQEEQEMGRNLQKFFAYSGAEIAGGQQIDTATTTFKRIVLDSEEKIAKGEQKGFYELVGKAMDESSKAFDASARAMAAKYGLYAHRPITVFFDQSGITQFSKKTNAADVFRRLEFFDDAGKPTPIIDGIKKKFSDLKITTQLETEGQFAGAVEKFFVRDGKAILAGAQTDTSMFIFLETEAKKGVQGGVPSVSKGAYERLLEGGASGKDIQEISAAFKADYLNELKGAGLGQDVIDSAGNKLSIPDYADRLVRDLQLEIKRAKKIKVDPADPASPFIDKDEMLEISMLSASWKREPESLALMADDRYDFLPYQIYNDLGGWQAKGTTKFLKLNMQGYVVSDVENDLKYSYLKSPNAGCESNTVCLNQKGVEQKKVDVAEEQIKDYETAYVVSKSVDLKLKRHGPTSPLGAGVGAFSFQENPRFHLVSPCLAEMKFYESETEDGVVIADVDKCPTPGRSNYCYFDEGKFNEMASGFYGSLVCSVIADFGKFALVGFLLQPACSSIEVWTEYDTTWPFRPFQPLRKEHMNILQCNIEKNPKDAAKLAVKACCGIAQCTGDFVCSGIDYAEKNRLICGADKCTLEQLSKTTGEDYKIACGCG
ncbi:MAG: hypothetical protein HY051_06405 [Candidatus Aenigmarchaeota archaeon]|nr:hypothetical protein [Candidatus Aenigmarchaeota archaeon]